MLLTIPFVLVMEAEIESFRLWGAAIMAVAALTDKLDGAIARKFHHTSEWGRILDPLADKVAVAAVILVLLYRGEIPVWFVSATIGRDLLILFGGLYVKARHGVLLPSNEVGKWTVGIIALTLFLVLLDVWPGGVPWLMIAATGMMCLSLYLYGTRFVELFRNNPEA
jgi:CDP-diacylglycerol--glycerol-3-phosphate 3-phosphatidyltransferase